MTIPDPILLRDLAYQLREEAKPYVPNYGELMPRADVLMRRVADELHLQATAVEQASFPDVQILTMKLSGDREEHWVRIICDGKTFDVRNYGGDFRNRAEYEKAELRHVLLGEPKPDLMDPRYDDPADPTPLEEIAKSMWVDWVKCKAWLYKLFSKS